MGPNVTDPREKRWQRLLSTKATRQIHSIEISDSNVFADQVIDFSRVTAIVGRHGTGKSLLLRVIEALFGHATPAYAPPFVGQRPMRFFSDESSQISGIFRVKAFSPEGLVERVIDLRSLPEDRAKQWDIGSEAIVSASYATPTAAFSDINYMFDNYMARYREEEYEREASRAELDAIKNILGRSYDKLIYRSVVTDHSNGNYDYALMVSGLEKGKEINSWMMSQGELWVHYVLGYFLEDGVIDECIALLDEPETFLANSAQRPFLDQVARQILKTKSQLILGTHSLEILNRFPLENVRVCVRLNGKIHVIQPANFTVIKDAVGIESPAKGTVLVEDELAAEVLRVLFSIYDVALNRDMEIVQSGGESEVRMGTRALRHAQRLCCLGVLDGDQREQLEPSGRDAGRISYLPGRSSPEQELLDGVLLHVDFFSHLTGKSVDGIMTAVDSCAALDHQYQIKRFSDHFGMSKDAMIEYLVRTWIKSPEIESQAQALVASIRACINK